MFMTPAGFFILIVLALIGLWIFVALGSLPGKKAAERNHAQAEAINILGWLGLLFGGMGWMVALVWAHTKPVLAPVAQVPTASEAGAPEPATEEAS